MIREVVIKLTEEIKDEDKNTICSVSEAAQFVKNQIKYDFGSCDVEVIRAEDIEN